MHRYFFGLKFLKRQVRDDYLAIIVTISFSIFSGSRAVMGAIGR